LKVVPWTDIHKIKCACAGMIAVFHAVFRLMISYCIPEIFFMKSQSCPKSRPKCDILGVNQHGEKREKRTNKKLKAVKSCFWGYFGTSYSLFQTLLKYSMCRLATMHRVTDRRTDTALSCQ